MAFGFRQAFSRTLPPCVSVTATWQQKHVLVLEKKRLQAIRMCSYFFEPINSLVCVSVIYTRHVRAYCIRAGDRQRDSILSWTTKVCCVSKSLAPYIGGEDMLLITW